MSGSNRDVGGGNGTPPDSCETLSFTTQISSPRAEVIDQVQAGDVLDVALSQQGQQTVVVVQKGDKIVGGLASPQVKQLRECIQSNHEYSAEVLSKNEGQIRVRVRHK